MATVTETGTFNPVVELWQTPMRPDNTPVVRGSPIGRVTWFASVNTAAKITTNVVELAVSCPMPLNQYALRLMNAQWQVLITDAGAVSDMNDWSDTFLLTIPSDTDTLTINLAKATAATQGTITNQFCSQIIVPSLGGNVEASPGVQFSDPFIPLSPMIFRAVNISANASAVATWSSHMWAYLYTIEQERQFAIWDATRVGTF